VGGHPLGGVRAACSAAVVRASSSASGSPADSSRYFALASCAYWRAAPVASVRAVAIRAFTSSA
jgi:hypothetical protein